jgi:hypothetical protein
VFHLDYHLDGTGWSRATVADQDQTAHLTASYLSDALGDLTRATLALVRGARQATISWEEEPGEYRWLLTRTGGDLAIRILWFDDADTQQPDEAGRVVFATTCILTTFATALARQLQQLLDDLGVDGYKRQWVRHDFPLSELEALNHLLHSL